MTRISYADILKGILMFSVVAAHCNAAMSIMCAPSPGIVPYTLSLWHMPLFMAIAGYFFYYSAQKRTLAGLFKTKLLAILIPFVLWGVFENIAHDLVGSRHIEPAFKYLDISWNLWFLQSICLCFCLGVIPDRFFRVSPCLAHCIGVLICVALYMLPEVRPMNNYNIAYMFPFFYAGYLTNKYNLIARVKPYMICTCLVIAIAMWIAVSMGHFKGWSVWTSGTYLWGPLGFERHLYMNCVRLAMGFFGSVAFAGLTWYVYSWIKGKKFSALPIVRAVRCFFLRMGVFSLSVYAVQSIIVETVFKHFMLFLYYRGYLAAITPCNPFVYKYVYLLGVAVALSLVCLLLIAILSRVHLCRKYLLGK